MKGIGFLEVAFSRHSPLTFGVMHNGVMSYGYAQSGFWCIWSILITVYAFLPQLALLNNISIFPEVKSRWFLLYAFLFLRAYAQDLADFVLYKGTLHMWWNDQRMWNIRGLSSFIFNELSLIFLGSVRNYEGKEYGKINNPNVFISIAVINSWPVYEAMVLRSDNGKMPAKFNVLGTTSTCYLHCRFLHFQVKDVFFACTNSYQFSIDTASYSE
ncbi:cellulose synthase-like protein G2 [Jatropha curcas]|uniref:cellulose synthase-like protein G2 n=1 Tax=Jatropha curcas TaxID=180498 RepID=UPI0005FADB7D|nr:cellulose synthase-like protein G2 [Jatropha curcas]